jgi:integrase
VPLSSRAVDILSEMEALRSDANPFVFPGTKAGRPLSSMALEMLLRRMNIDATVHGFRSTFRTWAGDCTTHPREVAELALAHAVGNEVERSYNRGSALERRRLLMQLWADFLGQSALAEPTDLAAERARRQVG